MNRYFDFTASVSRFVRNTLARATDINARLDEITAGFDTVQTEMDLKAPLSTTASLQSQVDLKAPIASPTFTGTPAAPNPPSVATDTTQIATTAWVQDVIGATSVGLPVQTTHAGKFLSTDGTSAAWTAVPGQSGTTASGSITLTATSAGMQRVTTTAAGQSVTLPDATTCTKAATLFNIFNAGSWELLVKDSTGTILGAVAPRRMGVVGLASNATAAGVWSVNDLDFFFRDAEGEVTLSSSPGSYSTTCIYAVTLDASRTLVLMAGDSSLHGVVWDAATNSFGSAALIRTANIQSYYLAVKIDTDKVIVASCTATASTALEVVCLTFSGTTITVGVAATATLAAALTSAGFYQEQGGRMVACSATMCVLPYNTSTPAAAIRVITVTGTTCTIGAEYTTSGTGIQPLIAAIDSTRVLVVSKTTTSTVYARVATITGTTVSWGTEASFSSSGGYVGKLALLASGRYALIWQDTSTTYKGSILTISGANVTASSVALLGASSSSPSASLVVGSQVLVVATNGSTTNYCNVLTDNAGTAVAGTEGTILNSDTSLNVMGRSASELWIRTYPSGAGAQGGGVARLGISGNNPTLVKTVGWALGAAATIANPITQGNSPYDNDTAGRYMYPVGNNAAHTTTGQFRSVVFDGSSFFWANGPVHNNSITNNTMANEGPNLQWLCVPVVVSSSAFASCRVHLRRVRMLNA